MLIKMKRDFLTDLMLPPLAMGLTRVLPFSGLFGLSACSGINPNVYEHEKPIFDLKEYFNGDISAWGIFTDRSGEVVKRFKVDMKCSWKNEVGTFDESFLYSDGTRQKRLWTLHDLGNGQFSGVAADVIGQAMGKSSGNSFNWSYTLALPVNGKTWEVQFEDWMFLISDEVVINKAQMRKLGIFLGEVTISFQKNRIRPS